MNRGGGAALRCHLLVCLLQWLVSGQREGNPFHYVCPKAVLVSGHDSPSLVENEFIVVSPTTWALKVAFPGSTFWDLWGGQKPRRNAFS